MRGTIKIWAGNCKTKNNVEHTCDDINKCEPEDNYTNECELEDDNNEKTWTFKDEFWYVNDDENMENFG